MRKCPNCNELMKYNMFEEKWTCGYCGYEIDKVTEKGDRKLTSREWG